jgi:hypothetical protein
LVNENAFHDSFIRGLPPIMKLARSLAEPERNTGVARHLTSAVQRGGAAWSGRVEVANLVSPLRTFLHDAILGTWRIELKTMADEARRNRTGMVSFATDIAETASDLFVSGKLAGLPT